jgi:hypothetical protein
MVPPVVPQPSLRPTPAAEAAAEAAAAATRHVNLNSQSGTGNSAIACAFLQVTNCGVAFFLLRPHPPSPPLFGTAESKGLSSLVSPLFCADTRCSELFILNGLQPGRISDAGHFWESR